MDSYVTWKVCVFIVVDIVTQWDDNQ